MTAAGPIEDEFCPNNEYNDQNQAPKLTNSWDGGDDLSQLELIKNGGFTSSIKPHHENPHLLLAEEALEKGGEHVTHGCTDMTAGVVWRKFSSLKR